MSLRLSSPQLLQSAVFQREHKSKAERMLWGMLHGNFKGRSRVYEKGFRWRQKAVVLGRVADFYCPAAKLVVCFGAPVEWEKELSSSGVGLIGVTGSMVIETPGATRALIFNTMWARIRESGKVFPNKIQSEITRKEHFKGFTNPRAGKMTVEVKKVLSTMR